MGGAFPLGQGRRSRLRPMKTSMMTDAPTQAGRKTTQRTPTSATSGDGHSPVEGASPLAERPSPAGV